MKKLILFVFFMALICSSVVCKPAEGNAVTGLKGALTVTPRADGLYLKFDYSKVPQWKHLRIWVRDIEEWQTNYFMKFDSNVSECVYPFVEKDKKYQIWVTAYGENWNWITETWTDWENPDREWFEVTATGGAGNCRANCSDAAYYNHEIYLTYLSEIYPAVFKSKKITPQIRTTISVKDGQKVRWDSSKCWNDVACEKNGSIVKLPDAAREEKGKKYSLYEGMENNDGIFFEIKSVFSYNGFEYESILYANYNKLFVQRPLQKITNKLPVIKINASDNKGSFAFVNDVISKPVKLQERTWNGQAFQQAPDTHNEKCIISVIDENGTSLIEAAESKVKTRGNWTTTYPKKSFKVRFAEKQKMLDLNGGKSFRNWVLLACYKDASMLRDITALKMAKAMFPEYYVSDCKLVEVYVNNVYWGIYLLAEQQEAKKNRIKITETDKKTKTTATGYLLEYDIYHFAEPENNQFNMDYLGPVKDYYGNQISNETLQTGYTIKSTINNQAQKKFIQDYMNKLWKICYEASYNKKYYKFNKDYSISEYTPEGANDDEKCRNCISQIIDIDSLAASYIINELVCDPDLYLTSYMMDIDFGEGGDKKLRFEAPWDFDSALGNKRMCENGLGMYAGKTGCDVNGKHVNETGNPWMFIFIKCGWFQKLVKAKWAAVSATGKATAFKVIGSYAKYTANFENDRLRWGNAGENQGPDGEINAASKAAAKKSQAEAAKYLKNWLTIRFNEVGKIINGLNTR